MARKRRIPSPVPAEIVADVTPAVAPVQLSDPGYPALPRLLHRDGEHKRVDTPEQYDAAIADGWTLLP